MKTPETPANEAQRLETLRAYEVLDTPPEPGFDALTKLAAHIAGVPIALVSLVDVDRQWFKSRYGLDAPQTPRDVSFCGHVVASGVPLIVGDALADARFHDNPLVTGGPRVRFYAGVPLRAPDGSVLGTLCAIDHDARALTEAQREMLVLLARQVVDQLELRRAQRNLEARQTALATALEDASRTASRLRSILASANYAIIETTPDGTIREFNPAAERMLGYAAEEVVGKVSPAIFHVEAEVVARAQALSRELGTAIEPGFEAFVAKVREGGADEHEWTYVCKDGSRFPVHLSVTGRRDPSGEIVGYMGIASDITARRRAERAVEDRTALLGLSAAVARAFTTGEGLRPMLQACTEAIVQHLGAAFARIWTLDAASDVLEMQASAGMYTHLDGPHGRVPVGKFKIGWIAAHRRSHLTNSVVGDPLVGDQAWARREGLVSFAGYPLLLDGRLLGVLAMFARHPLTDATLEALGVVASTVAVGIDRKAAEARLRESESRSRSIIDTAVDAIVAIDELGSIQSVNPAVERIFGWAPPDVLGRNVKVLMPSPDHEQHDGYLAHYVRTGERKVIGIGREVLGARKDGSTFPAELSVSEFHVGGKRYFTGLVRDISDRKRVERLQSEFVSTVSHELRTPLTSIRGALGLVAGGVLGELPKEAREYVDIALSNCERLVRLINDILDMEKVQSGTMPLHLEAVELLASLRTAIDANATFAGAHGVRLEMAAGVPAGEVLVDRDRLAQVLANLVSNAVKFSPKGSAVEVGAHRVGERFRVTVRDHGPGIPEEFRGRIFQRFAQADASSTRQKGGTGLGLNISKALVEKMRGRIGFEDATGGGTTFFFELPFLAPVASDARATPGTRLVLVCEDDPDVGRFLERILVPAGYAIHVAPTLERARRLLATNRYEAVTLDLVLADGDGQVLIGEIRDAEATRHLPIIVVSGSSRNLGPSAVLVTAVLGKPIDEERLIGAIRGAVADRAGPAPRLLHVEDDADLRRVVTRSLPTSWTVVGVDSLQAARKALGETEFDLVILDLSLPDGGGEELLGLVGRAEVIIFSGTDAPAELSRRVSAALVKSRSTPGDVREAVVALLAKARGARSAP